MGVTVVVDCTTVYIVLVLPVSFACMSATVAEDGVLEPSSPSPDEEITKTTQLPLMLRLLRPYRFGGVSKGRALALPAGNRVLTPGWMVPSRLKNWY